MAMDGCKHIYALQKEALKNKYMKIKDENKEEAEE
jgi:hypothetical protein